MPAPNAAYRLHANPAGARATGHIRTELGAAIDASQPLGTISPLVFGSTYGPWVSLRPETLPLADAAGITLLRYPDVEWGDKNELKSFQIDQLVDLARWMGAEPYVCVRLPGGSPEKAAALVKYANIDKQYKIKFWSIGNQPSLYAGSEPGGGWVKDVVWDTEHFNREWRTYADQENTPATLAEIRTNRREWNQIIPALRQLIKEQILLFDQTHNASEVAIKTIVQTSGDELNVTLPPQSITLLIFPAPASQNGRAEDNSARTTIVGSNCLPFRGICAVLHGVR